MTALEGEDKTEIQLATDTLGKIVDNLDTLLDEDEANDKLDLSRILTQDFAKALEKNPNLIDLIATQLYEIEEKLNKWFLTLSSDNQTKFYDLRLFITTINSNYDYRKEINHQPGDLQQQKNTIDQDLAKEPTLIFEKNLSIMYYNTWEWVWGYNIRSDFRNALDTSGPLMTSTMRDNFKVLSSVDKRGQWGRHIWDVGAIQSFLESHPIVSEQLMEEFQLDREQLSEKLKDKKLWKITRRWLEMYRDYVSDTTAKLQTIEIAEKNSTSIQDEIQENNETIQTITEKYKEVPKTTPELSDDTETLLNMFPEELKNDNGTREKIKNVITNLTGLWTGNVKDFIEDIYDPFSKKAHKIIDKINALSDDQYHNANENKLLNKLVKVVRKWLVEKIKKYITEYSDDKENSPLRYYSFTSLYSDYKKIYVDKISVEEKKRIYSQYDTPYWWLVLARHNKLENAGIHVTGPANEPEIEFKGDLKDLLYKSYDANNQQSTAGGDSGE